MTKLSALSSVTPADDDLVYLGEAQGTSPETYASKGATVAGIRNVASASDIRAGTAGKAVTADGVESAAELVTLTDGATVAVDWSTFLTAQVTLGDNRTLGNPSNGEPGTWRTIIVNQDGTGSRTLAFDTQYKFAGGTAPTLTTDASAKDVLSILCETTSSFLVFSALDLR